MSTTLPYTRKLPDTGDDSAQWFSDLEDNIVVNDSHDHDGVNSSLLDSQSIGKVDVVVKATTDWSGSAGSWSLTIPNGSIPAGYKETGKSSSELTSLTIMDSDSSDERVYLKHTWFGSGNTATVTLYSNTKLNLKILFI